MKKNSVQEFNKKIDLYRKINKQGKYIICWHKQIKCFCFFEADNIEAIKLSSKIEIIF